MIVEILRERGITAAAYHSKMSVADQDDALMAFETGQIRALVNGDMLTTGYDFPALDCIILLRATESPGLHVQILGRGTRPVFIDGFDLETIEGRLASISASDKQDCLVLDFAGNTMRLGPVNDPRIPKRKGDKGGDMPVKVCDACGCMNHISARFCINKACGEEFTFKEKITSTASTAVLIAKKEDPIVEVFAVDTVNYSKHAKLGSSPSLRVDYFCGIRRFSEWVTIEHDGGALIRAQKWWKLRYPAEHYPPTVDDALKAVDYLKIPRAIRVWLNKNKGGKHPQVMSAIFEEH
jgi:DNA repair protein RadD